MKYFWKFALWTIIILVLSLTPQEKIPKVSIVNFDKFVHLIMYFLQVSLLLYAYYKKFHTITYQYYLLAGLTGIFTGGIIELLQGTSFINRNADWIDFIANSLGTALAILLFSINKRILERLHL